MSGRFVKIANDGRLINLTQAGEEEAIFDESLKVGDWDVRRTHEGSVLCKLLENDLLTIYEFFAGGYYYHWRVPSGKSKGMPEIRYFTHPNGKFEGYLFLSDEPEDRYVRFKNTYVAS